METKEIKSKVLYRGQLLDPLVANKIANLIGADIDLQLTDEKANIIDIMNIRNTEIRRTLHDQIDLEAELMTHSKLIDKKVVKKKYNFYELHKETKKDFVYKLKKGYYDDVYELYEVNDAHYVACYCVSTGRRYFLGVELDKVIELNKLKKPCAIAAIAWTIRVPVDVEITAIYRQGDCLAVNIPEPITSDCNWFRYRHITRKEYLKLLKSES